MAVVTEKVTMLTRRGLKKNFDPDQMTAGEWAVSIDTIKENQIVWMCFAPGVVKRMGTWDDFKDAIHDISDDIADQYIKTFNEIKAAMEQIKSQTEGYKNTASAKASESSASAATASQKATNAANSANTAATKAAEASKSASDADIYATEAESYARGGTGTRPGEDADNAKKYYEQARDVSQSLTGALKPMGTVVFSGLPALSAASSGDMYNISTAFTTTVDFKEGSEHKIPAGANVYKTADGKWDILAGTPVSSVNGKTGDVNITPANIGALSTSGGTVNGETTINNIKSINFRVEDVGGKMKWLIMFDVTDWYNAFGTTKKLLPNMFNGFFIASRTSGGYIFSTKFSRIDVGCSYRRESAIAKDNSTSCRLRTENINLRPAIIKNTESNKYFLVLSITGSDAKVTLAGFFTGKYIGEVLYAETLGSDLSVNIPSGYELISVGYKFINEAIQTQVIDTHALLGTAGAVSTVQSIINENAERIQTPNYNLEPIEINTSSWQKISGLHFYTSDYFPATKEVHVVGIYHSPEGVESKKMLFTVPDPYKPKKELATIGFSTNDFVYNEEISGTETVEKLANQSQCCIYHTHNGEMVPYCISIKKSYRITFDLTWRCS